MNRNFILAIILLLFTTNSFAQNNGQTIRGTVVDAFTGSPIIGATIMVLETNPIIVCITGDNGDFVIKNIQPGRWSFAATYDGYKSQPMSNLMVISGKETTLNFKLEEKVNALNEVVVKASHSKERPINEMALISARSFSVEETERFAGRKLLIRDSYRDTTTKYVVAQTIRQLTDYAFFTPFFGSLDEVSQFCAKIIN